MQNYNLPTVNFDNTFSGVEFTLEAFPAINLAGAVAKIQVRRSAGLAVAQEFISPATLTITQPNKVSIPAQIITIPAGNYKWDLKIKFADNTEKTYIGGDWIINSVITTD